MTRSGLHKNISQNRINYLGSLWLSANPRSVSYKNLCLILAKPKTQRYNRRELSPACVFSQQINRMLEVSEKQRPVYLNLAQFHFPPMAIVSICHRISGVLLFLFLPLMLYILHQAVHSADSFAALTLCLQNGFMKFLVWVMLSAIWFHVVAGIRHLIMDLGIGESLNVARASSYAVFVIVAVLLIIMGVWLW